MTDAAWTAVTVFVCLCAAFGVPYIVFRLWVTVMDYRRLNRILPQTRPLSSRRQRPTFLGE